MGLDCSHNAWNGSYSAFARWRDFIAERGGYDFIETDRMRHPNIDWEKIEVENYAGKVRNSPIDLKNLDDLKLDQELEDTVKRISEEKLSPIRKADYEHY